MRNPDCRRLLIRAAARAQDVIEVEEVDLPILEIVEAPGEILLRLRAGQGQLEAIRQQLEGLAESPARHVRGEQRQELLVLQAHEILPEKGARPQELREVAQHPLLGEQLQPSALLRQGEKVPQELLETQERGEGIRGAPPLKTVNCFVSSTESLMRSMRVLSVIARPAESTNSNSSSILPSAVRMVTCSIDTSWSVSAVAKEKRKKGVSWEITRMRVLLAGAEPTSMRTG